MSTLWEWIRFSNKCVQRSSVMHNSLIKRWLVSTYFRGIVRPVYQNPRKFRPIFGQSPDLCISTHESSGPFSVHHQTFISVPTKVSAHFRSITRPLYQYPRKFRPIFSPSPDLYISTHESFGPFSVHHQTSVSVPTKVPTHFQAIVRPVYQNSRKFRPTFGSSSDLYTRTQERNWNGPKLSFMGSGMQVRLWPEN